MRSERNQKSGNSKSSAKGKRTVGEDLINSVEQIIAWSRGEDVAVRLTHVPIPVSDVRAIRKRLKLSQARFAERFGFSTASVRNWEQGRTQPEGPARVLLAVIAKHPEAVEDVVQDLNRAA